jgi:L-lactate dehydrogenase complex protein LldG
VEIASGAKLGRAANMSTAESKARETILAKLRARAADPTPLFRTRDVDDDTSAVPRPVTASEGRGLELAKRFGENLSAVLGSYEIVEQPEGVASRIVTQIERWRTENEGVASSGSELLSWAPDDLPIVGLSEQLKQRGFSLFVPSDLADAAERTHAASLPIGLTGADAAFAGTGSVVLVPGPGKSRVASLLPLHHIALVPVSKIHATGENWLASLRREGKLEPLFRDHSQLVFVTGPSKSADIELNLTLGVHGPRDVHAIVFDDGRTGGQAVGR